MPEIKLLDSIKLFNTTGFRDTLKHELQRLHHSQLPLQKALTYSNVVSNKPFQVMILSDREQQDEIQVKAGIFYTGITTGCHCSDDPSPDNEQNEYCEVIFLINKANGNTTVQLVKS